MILLQNVLSLALLSSAGTAHYSVDLTKRHNSAITKRGSKISIGQQHTSQIGIL